MEIYRGIVASYDETNHKADVMLLGSMSGVVLGVPVAYQVAPEQLVADAACGVVFFGEGDAGVVICTFGEVAGPLPSDGWEDDFQGDSLAPEYLVSGTGGSTAVLQAVHGGVLRLTSAANIWSHYAVYLGGATHAESSIDADVGWVQTALMRLVGTTTYSRAVFGGTTAADVIYAGAETGEANWVIITQVTAGWTVHASSTPIDTDWHLHRLRARPTSGGRELKHYLDGVVINTVTTGIPTNPLTPLIIQQTCGGGVAKVSEWDRWTVKLMRA